MWFQTMRLPLIKAVEMLICPFDPKFAVRDGRDPVLSENDLMLNVCF